MPRSRRSSLNSLKEMCLETLRKPHFAIEHSLVEAKEVLKKTFCYTEEEIEMILSFKRELI
jgi:hypothetical protein